MADHDEERHEYCIRESTTEAIYEDVLARVRSTQDDESNHWSDLTRLRTFLHAKESIHVVYVKVGFHLKRLLLELGRRWCETGMMMKILGSITGGERGSEFLYV